METQASVVSTQPESSPRLLRIGEVQKLTSLGRTSIYTLAAKGAFPKQIKLHSRAAAWVESEVLAWVESRINEREERG